MPISLNISNAYGKLTANCVIYNGTTREPIFISAFGVATAVSDYVKKLSLKHTRINVYNTMNLYTHASGAYDTFVSGVPNTDYSHIIAMKKNNSEIFEDNSWIGASIVLERDSDISSLRYMPKEEYPQDLVDAVYRKLLDEASCYVDRSWVRYIMYKMIRSRYLTELDVTEDKADGATKFLGYEIQIANNTLINLISTGLKDGDISISVPGLGGEMVKARSSEKMTEIAGLNDYLDQFPDALALKIQKSFSPFFQPGKEYSETLLRCCDYAEWHGHLKFFSAQKDIAQATANALDVKKASLIIGECGTGKTGMAILSVMAHNRDKKKLVNVVMCPPHLVDKWRKEIARIAPLSETIVIRTFQDIADARKYIIKQKKRPGGQRRHIWLILSKESAKLSYMERPAAVWKYNPKLKMYCYHCPECGGALCYSSVIKDEDGTSQAITHYLGPEDFLKKGQHNVYCERPIRMKDREAGKESKCGAYLWEPAYRYEDDRDDNGGWVKIGKEGWIRKEHIKQVQERLIREAGHGMLKKKDGSLMIALTKYLEEENAPVAMPKKYPLAKYIRRSMKGIVDYFLADELHELKSKNSSQGEAFGDLVFAARKTIGLTGTLLNGYSSGIYYILFRMFGNAMKADGFDFRGETKFVKRYGVTKKTEIICKLPSGKTKKRQTSGEMPGVSPLVFTKFLLENAAFISLDDVSDGLPSYKETPMPIEMDSEQKDAYQQLSDKVAQLIYQENGVNRKIASQLLPRLLAYPDQPFDALPIYDEEDNTVIYNPVSLDKKIRPKEQALIDLVKEKVDAGEKVLVFYSMTGVTNLGNRIPELLRENGITAFTMATSTAESGKYVEKVDADKREEWIEKKVQDGMQVLVCNPRLVETGLDLLDFTTIVFFQMGYNLFTLRQASRRSWRLSQDKDVEVYFMYYAGSVQESTMSLMATKLQAAMAIEGKFSEEGLSAMSNNQDILSKIAATVVDGITEEVDTQVFEKANYESTKKTFAASKKAMDEKKKEEDVRRLEIRQAKVKYRSLPNIINELIWNPYELLDKVS